MGPDTTDADDTRERLIEELEALRVKVAALEQSEAERARSEEQLRYQATLMQTVGEAIISTDMNWVVRSWNKAAETIYGWRVDEALGKPLGELTAPEYPRESRESVIQQLLETGFYKGETIQHRKDGTPIHILASVVMLRDDDGNPSGAVAVNRDITERMRAKQALRESQRLLEMTFASLHDAVFIIDADTVEIVDCNPAASAMFDYGLDEMLGRTTAFLHVDEATLEEFRGHLYPAIEEKGFLFLPEFRMKRKDGKVFPTEHSVVPLQDEQGKRIGWVSVVRDITERVRAEEAHRAVVERSLQGLAIVQENRIVFANPAFAEMLGCTVEEVLSLSPEEMTEIVHPDDQALAWGRFRDRLAGKAVPERYTFRVIGKDGTRRWLEVFPSLIEYRGEPAIQSAFMDITERVQAEEALRESEEKYRNLVERANDGIIIIQDHIVQYANPRLAEMWGGTPEEMIGTPVADYIHPDEEPKLADRYRRRMAGEDVPPVYETVLRRKDGSGYPAELNAGVITYRGKPADLVMIRDITERVQAEEALRESEARFRAIFEGQAIGVALVDPEGRFMASNPVLQEMLDYSQEELRGTAFAEVTHPDDVEADWRLAQELFEGKRDHYQMEKRYIRKDGRVIWGRLTASLIRDATGKPQFGIGVVEDITERVRAEEALREEGDRAQRYLDVAGVMLVVTGADGKIGLMNRRGCEILGYEEEEILGRRFDNFIPEGVESEVRAFFGKVMAGESEPFEYFEHPILTKSGEERIIASRTTVLRDEEGQIVATLSSGEDITERVQAEGAEREQRALAEALADTAAAINSTLDLDEVLKRILANVGRVAPHDAANILLIEDDFARIVRGRNYVDPELTEEVIQAVSFPIDDTRNLREMIQSGQPLAIPDTRAYSGWITFPKTRWVRSYAGAPVRLAGQTIGFVEVDSATPDFYTPVHAERLQAFADQAAVAIQNARLYEQAQHHLESLTNLNRASQVITSFLDLKGVLQQIIALTGSVVKSDYTSVILLDEDGQPVRGGEDFRGVPPISERIRRSGTTRYVLDSGQALVVDDISDEGVLSPPLRRPDGELLKANPPLVKAGIRSFAAVPIQAGEETLGVLYVHSREPRAFHGQLPLLMTFANHATVAIQNARLYQAETQRASELEVLREVSLGLTAELDLGTLLRSIAERAIELLNAKSGGMYLYRPERNVLVWEVAVGPGLSPPGAELRRGEGLSGKVWETGEPLIVDDYHHWEGRAPAYEDYPWKAVLGVPIVWGDKFLGVVNVIGGAEARTFTQDDARLLSMLAAQAAVAIQNARLYHELEEYSSILEQAIEERTAELRRTKEQVESILDSSSDAILLLRPDGAIQSGNPAFSELFGYRINEVYGQLPTSLVEPDHIELCKETLRFARDEGRAVRLEAIARRKEGTMFDADIAIAPIEEEGVVTGLVCSLRDISALKEVQRMKDAFVSNVSHELRTPITSLKLYHGLLRDNLPHKHRRYLDVVRRETERLALIIEDLLRLSRLDQGQVTLNLTGVDLNALAGQYVADRTLLAEERELSLTFESEPNLPVVLADEGLLGQVLSVLLTNAFNYTPAGGRVEVSTRARELEGDPGAGISVSDTGPGISPEEQPHVFERFFRGRTGHESGKHGTGLGLAIAKEIVERHYGRIEVASEGVAGEGATFSVWLPAAR